MSFFFPRQREVLRETIGGGARYVQLYGGSRSGKTALIVSTLIARCLCGPGGRHLGLRKYRQAAEESLYADTIKKVFKLHYPGVGYKWNGRYSMLEIDTPGDPSELWIGGIDDPDRFDKILGKEFVTIYLNEASEIGFDIFSALKSRLAQVVPSEHAPGGVLSQRMFIDLNPAQRAHWTAVLFLDGVDPATGAPVTRGDYACATMHPKDNPHLGEEYLRSLDEMSPRDRKRFWDGEYSEEAEGALWRRDMIRYSPTGEAPPNLRRVVVSIDPAISSEVMSDITGIVVCAVDEDGKGWVLDDQSGRYSPNEWARRALNLFEEYEADALVSETNQGGDMVESVIRAEEKELRSRTRAPVNQVKAWRGKYLRAEPVASLYEKGEIIHRRRFPDLETQMLGMTPDFDRKKTGYSPDRLDAMVHGFTDLFSQMTRRRTDRPIEPRRTEMRMF